MGYCGLGHYENLEEEVQAWGPIGTSVSYSGTHNPIKKLLQQQEQREQKERLLRGELLKSTEPDGNVNCIA